MRAINKLVVHCAYTPPSMDIGADTITEWHVGENGWSDIGYHFVIRRSGVIEKGRPIERPGAHVRGHNRDSIGICLVGGMAEDQSSADCNFTVWQWDALGELLTDLQDEFGYLDICGHRDLDPGKECPCFDVRAFYER